MDNTNPHGFFPGQPNPEPSPPPISGGTTHSSSAQPQRGRDKGSKNAPVRLHGHLLDFAGVSKPRFKRKPPDPSSANATAPCTECGKRFWSQKALFGHMRCHPERQWRGINPPPHLRRPQSSFHCPSPPVQRPRLPLGGQQLFNDVEHEVATYLLMLANGPTPAVAPGVMADRGGAVDAAFEWSSRTTSFGSHQARGGQLPAHENAAVCFALARNEGEEEESGISSSNNVSSAATGGISSGHRTAEGMVMMGSHHMLSVCKGVSSSSGQALVEHVRRLWDREDERATSSPLGRGYVPDLNLPPPLENNEPST